MYCDTDSIIRCGLRDVDIDPARLSAWILQDEFTSVRIAEKQPAVVNRPKIAFCSFMPEWNCLASIARQHAARVGRARRH